MENIENAQQPAPEQTLTFEDHLTEQMVNELRHLLLQLNEKYKEFYHYNLLTVVQLNDQTCQLCIEGNKKCLRAAVGYHKEEVVEGSVVDNSETTE